MRNDALDAPDGPGEFGDSGQSPELREPGAGDARGAGGARDARGARGAADGLGAPGQAPAHVLVVDDDPTVAEVVAGYLDRAGHDVERAPDGPSALAQFARRRPDLVVLDLMLPGMDGFEVCRRMRRLGGGPVPVIMLTARGDEEDRVLGLETGADDYVTKPFSPRELVLRVGSVLRRARATVPAPGTSPAGDVLRTAGLTLDPAARRATREGAELALTLREFDLLAFFLRHPARAFSREELMREVWGWDFGDLSTVTVHVRRLRAKVEHDPASPRLIQTVWGVGYRFASTEQPPTAEGSPHTAEWPPPSGRSAPGSGRGGDEAVATNSAEPAVPGAGFGALRELGPAGESGESGRFGGAGAVGGGPVSSAEAGAAPAAGTAEPAVPGAGFGALRELGPAGESGESGRFGGAGAVGGGPVSSAEAGAAPAAGTAEPAVPGAGFGALRELGSAGESGESGGFGGAGAVGGGPVSSAGAGAAPADDAPASRSAGSAHPLPPPSPSRRPSPRQDDGSAPAPFPTHPTTPGGRP